MTDKSKPYLSYLEYHVTDRCNLKCKGCGHFCNLVEEDKGGNLDNYTRDLKRLKELYAGVKKIRLMGGEPLLNKQLPLFIQITREIFPDCDIRVVTNGLLIQEDKQEELYQCMRDNKCKFDISAYPPTVKKLPYIKKTLEKFKVEYRITGPVNKFYKQLSLKKNPHVEKIFKNCGSRGCHFLRNGRIAVCPLILLKDIINEKYSLKIEGDEGINLYDENLDGESLNEKLNNPSLLCQYCSEVRVWYPWEGGRTRADSELSDWFTTEKERKRYTIANKSKETVMGLLLWIKHHMKIKLSRKLQGKLKKLLKN